MNKIISNNNRISGWQEAEKIIPDNKTELGIHFTERGTVIFRIWSPAAFSVKIQFYKDWKSNSPDMTQACLYDRKSGVWSYEHECGSHIDGWFYEYVIDTGSGEKVCLDPYAVSMAAFCNDGTPGRAAVVDIHSDKAIPCQCRDITACCDMPDVVANSMQCGSDENTAKCGENTTKCGASSANNGGKYANSGVCRGTDAIVYEVSIRDSTINPDGSGGTYDAFKKRLDYLARLGVTHIQLMPVLNFYYNDELNKKFEAGDSTQKNNYNWGYDPHSWFTPEGWYSAEPENPYARIKELRDLVSAAHHKGLRIILDVVYNHMSRTSLLDDIVPGYYFRMDKNGGYLNGSGCGNDTASEHAMMRRLIIDSATYWVKEYGVDGFRFDLMGLIDSETMLLCYDACKKVKDDILFIGEGWKLYTGAAGTVGMDQNYMTKTDDIAVFNDEFRDLCKGGGFNERMPAFLNGGDLDSKKMEKLFYNCTGRPQTNYTADNPADSVLYIDCHDGLTLHDSLCLNTDADESSVEGRAQLLKRLKLANALLLTSQGIVFIHAGQEFGRSKALSEKKEGMPETESWFVKNSYKSTDSINRIHWQPETDAEKTYSRLMPYTQGLISLRKSHKVFRLKTQAEIEQAARFIAVPDEPQVLFYSLFDGDYCWYLAFNGSEKDVSLTLPCGNAEPAAISELKAEVFVDGENASDKVLRVEVLTNNAVSVAALSAKVIRVRK